MSAFPSTSSSSLVNPFDLKIAELQKEFEYNRAVAMVEELITLDKEGFIVADSVLIRKVEDLEYVADDDARPFLYVSRENEENFTRVRIPWTIECVNPDFRFSDQDAGEFHMLNRMLHLTPEKFHKLMHHDKKVRNRFFKTKKVMKKFVRYVDRDAALVMGFTQQRSLISQGACAEDLLGRPLRAKE